MRKYNTDFLVKVMVRDFRKASFYYYQIDRVFLGIPITKKSVRDITGSMVTETNLQEKLIFRDGIVYERPICRLSYVDGSEKEYIFDTHDEAIDFGKHLTDTPNWIE